ncbi:hypothetical protein KKG31_05225 [Patescibacteria group bacterium]|nr:hypothetical protein [Patescibacteria group bacterium]
MCIQLLHSIKKDGDITFAKFGFSKRNEYVRFVKFLLEYNRTNLKEELNDPKTKRGLLNQIPKDALVFVYLLKKENNTYHECIQKVKESPLFLETKKSHNKLELLDKCLASVSA